MTDRKSVRRAVDDNEYVGDMTILLAAEIRRLRDIIDRSANGLAAVPVDNMGFVADTLRQAGEYGAASVVDVAAKHVVATGVVLGESEA